MTPTSAEHSHASQGPGLRLAMLNRSAADCGITPSPDYPSVYGVLMDWPIDDQFATVAALCDGNASLYTTSTFGIIGGIGHESVRTQAHAFVKAAAEFRSDAKATNDFAYPRIDHVRFYLLTFGGVHLIEAPIRAVTSGNHRTSSLFGHAQAVITELRRTVQQASPDQSLPVTSQRKEFSGAAGYVHCLLTAMSEGAIRDVEINAAGSLPSLTDLATSNPATRQWLIAQDFASERIDPRQVITIISRMAGLFPLPFLTRKGSIRAVHAQPDGTGIPCQFRVALAPFGRQLKVSLST